jgi:hypothetical protein
MKGMKMKSEQDDECAVVFSVFVLSLQLIWNCTFQHCIETLGASESLKGTNGPLRNSKVIAESPIGRDCNAFG